MKILSVDPGTATGWSIFDTNRRPLLLQFGIAKPMEKFYDLLLLGDFNDVDKVVVEDYKIRPANLSRGFDHTWNSGSTLQVIGAIQLWAREYSIGIVLQQPAIKPVAAGWTRLPYKKGKANMHHMDAQLHGLYYLIKNKIISPEAIYGQPI